MSFFIYLRNNKKNILIITLFFLCMFVYTEFLFKDSVLAGDDTFGHFVINGIKFLKTFHYGSYVMWIMNTILYVIPHKLNINIQDWCLIAGSIFKSGIITSIFIYIYKFTRKNNISIINSLFIVSILYMLYFLFFSKIYLADFTVYEGFFRFIVPSFLMEVFLFYFYCLQKNEKINMPALMIFSIFAAAASEVSAIILISVVFLNIIFHSIKGFKSNLIDKNKKFMYYILLMLIIGFALLILSEGFQAHISEKTLQPNFNLNSIIEFCITFLNMVILNYIAVYIIIAIFYIRNKSNEHFPITILLGNFLFYLSLFFAGKTSYNNYFWLDHNDLYSFLIMSLVVSLSCCIKNINFKLYLLFIAIIFIPFFNSCILLKSTLLNIKDFSYARDKIRMFYYYKNLPPIMPEFAKSRMFLSVITRERMYIEDKHPIKNNFSDEEEYRINLLMNIYYYPGIYKTEYKSPNNIIWTIRDSALWEYKQLGGTLNEVKTGKYKFSDLMNEKFVVNTL